MKSVDIVLALAVALVWGLAFVFTRFALDTLSPPLLMALRFAIAALFVLVLPRPAIGWPLMTAIAATWFVSQFLFQFIGIAMGVPTGIAAVVVQSQVLFTVALAIPVLGERPNGQQLAAMAAASAGLCLIAASTGGTFDLGALALLALSPISFAIGNLLLRRVSVTDRGALVAWLSLIPPLPGLVIALAWQGPAAMLTALAETGTLGWLSVLYLALVATLFGYAAWGRLMQAYPAATLAPFPLLVPVIGALASWLILGERFQPVQIAGMVLVLVGLAILLMPAARLTR
ncbi:EamA family transporter [Phreatobacter aquaticus]|uniref:EamA family transporter n=1 Tax=Phreatobacter aquaticus TaxID=2570229 RepID=A0A4D7QJG4_9HYPH|nr:EamA family transporter [Phreatobacter aquaticus]QCK85869.1 EamA family transporter [Phreatobacter aquaticus]